MHDVDIWIDCEWFMELDPIDKCAFLFIIDRCDNVGVWKPNFKLAETCINGKPNWIELPEKVNNNIEILDCGKWWIPDFCEFQYKELDENSTSKPIQSYIGLLKKHGLFDRVCKGYTKGMDSVQDKEKEKDKDKEKDKQRVQYAIGVKMLKEEYDDMCGKYGKQRIDTFIQKLSDYQQSTGKRYKSMPATIKNWMRREYGVDSIDEVEAIHKKELESEDEPLTHTGRYMIDGKV